MNLSTIDMPRGEARRAFLDYRKAVRERHCDEDAAIMRGYRELAKGTPLIRLPEVLIAGGVQEFSYEDSRWDREKRRNVPVTRTSLVPRLAFCRADATKVWTRGIQENGRIEFRYRKEIAPHNMRDRFAVGGFPEATDSGWRDVAAVVPNVPPPLRPAAHLRNYHLLWEAEWAFEPKPPVDPALLKHIGGDLYAVLAIWELTPLEQAVLAGTRS